MLTLNASTIMCVYIYTTSYACRYIGVIYYNQPSTQRGRSCIYCLKQKNLTQEF